MSFYIGIVQEPKLMAEALTCAPHPNDSLPFTSLSILLEEDLWIRDKGIQLRNSKSNNVIQSTTNICTINIAWSPWFPKIAEQQII